MDCCKSGNKIARSGSFRLRKPTIFDYIRKIIFSESFAWAAQNAVGALFTVLFSVVWRMSFTLSCVSTALYAAGSQVLSLDRTIGGRLFAGSIFVGCMLSGGVIGGAISSLAWVAHGSSDGLYHYFEEGIENPLLQNFTIIQNVREEQIKQLAGQGIEFIDSGVAENIAQLEPRFLLIAENDIFNALGSFFPPIETSYWVLLIVLFAIVSIPFAIGRAHENFKVGLLMGIATLFMGSQVVFATLTPILGIRQYWTQIVSGYIKVALVNGGAMCCTALLVFVKSSHDSVREQMGQLLEDSGALCSKLSSKIACIVNSRKKKDVGPPKRYYSELDSAREEALAIAEDTVRELGLEKSSVMRYKDDEEGQYNHSDIPDGPNAFELRGRCQNIDDSLAICLFEMPLPEISSHVGARRSDFVEILDCIRTLLSTLCCIETIHVQAGRELDNIDIGTLVYIMASASSTLADLSNALNLVRTSQCCKGPQISWKPKAPEYWEELENMVSTLANSASDAITGINMSLSSRGRDAMLLLMNLESLIHDMKQCEVSISRALDVSKPTQPVSETIKNKNLKEKLIHNAYIPSLLVHTALLSGGAVYMLVILSLVKLFKGTKAFFRSAEERLEIIRDRHVQYAFKYWMGLSLTIMSIVLILWKTKFSSENQLQNAFDLTYFFFVWQPIYFWLTAAICIQFQVEAAAFRAVLRTTMTAIGGTLGWFTMMNGSLAQNPYFIAGIVSLFNGVCGLISPIKEFRYSLFLAAFTFNAVVVCQYYGCCNLAGETNIYGGKVLSTLLGSIYSILLSWCILPYYTSTKMLDLEHQVLKDGLSLVARMHSTDFEAAHKDNSGLCNESENKSKSELTLGEVNMLIDVPLTLIHKELEANVIDKRQFLLVTWTVLPTPKIVDLIKMRLEAIGVFLREFLKISSTTMWQSGDLTENYKQLLLDTQSITDDIFDRARKMVAGCQLTFDATSKRSLNEARKALDFRVKELEEVRENLKSVFIQWDQSHENLSWSEIELKALARKRLLLMVIKEIHVIGILLSETEATIDRDRWLSWASSWFGRRPF